MNCNIPTNYNGINGIKENNTNQMGMNQMGVNPIFNFYRLLSIYEGLCHRLSHIEMNRMLKEEVKATFKNWIPASAGMTVSLNRSAVVIPAKAGAQSPSCVGLPHTTSLSSCEGRRSGARTIQEKIKQKTKSIIQNKPTSKSKLISKSTPKTLKSKPTPKTQTKQSLTQQTNSRPKQSPKSKPRQKPFISITYNNGIVEKSYISKEEQMVLTLAVLRGYGLINMLNRKQSIYNLFNRGLLTLNENGFTKVRNEISDIILSGKPRGSRVFANKMGNVNSLGGDIGRVEWGFRG